MRIRIRSFDKNSIFSMYLFDDSAGQRWHLINLSNSYQKMSFEIDFISLCVRRNSKADRLRVAPKPIENR